MTERKHILVTGPTRSGKSEWAEWLAVQSRQSVVYVATSQRNTDDREWQARIATHCQRRPRNWQTLEVPVDLTAALKNGQAGHCWLVDSLGTWLANCLDQPETAWSETVANLLETIAAFPGTLIFVAEETGWGVVPAYPMGRTFRDRLGALTRQIGAIADATYLVVAGRAVDLNQIGVSVPSLANTSES
ncbi:MAG: bifunctional adenosylcobinamide kinase/adenosylcobinamide-phosphate guanylyltransferase [Cyanobacteria bacterium P01_F01_bin.86]